MRRNRKSWNISLVLYLTKQAFPLRLRIQCKTPKHLSDGLQEFHITIKIYQVKNILKLLILILPQIISWKINVYIITVVHVHWMHFNFNRMQVIIQFLLSKWGEIIHSFKVTEALTNTNFSLADPWFLDVINWKDDKVWAISKRRPYYILKKIWL